MNAPRVKLLVILVALLAGGALLLTTKSFATGSGSPGERHSLGIVTPGVLDDQLSAALRHHGFTGRVGLSMEQRLGRKIDNQLADLGRNLFHDTIVGLNDDN